MAVTAEHDFWGSLSVVLLAIVGVASLAVLVSKNSNTSAVIASTGSAFTGALGMAISPITGASMNSMTFPIG